MKVAQAEVLCRIDEDGIGIRNVNAALNDGSGQKHIIIVVHKTKNYLFQILRFHLSMSDSYPTVGNMPKNERFQFLQVLYTVIYKEHLSIATHFKVNRLSNDFFVEGMYFCLDGITVGGWRLDDR